MLNHANLLLRVTYVWCSHRKHNGLKLSHSLTVLRRKVEKYAWKKIGFVLSIPSIATQNRPCNRFTWPSPLCVFVLRTLPVGLKTTQKSLHQHQKACIRSQRCRWDTNIYTGGIDTAEVEVQIPNSNPRMGTHLHFSFGASGLKIHTSSTFHLLKLLQNASKTVFATPPPVSIKFSICLKGQRHK